MKYKYLSGLLVIMFCFSLVRAQHPFSKVFDFQVNKGNDIVNSFEISNDTLYMVVEVQLNGTFGTKVVKMDAAGNIFLERKFSWMHTQRFSSFEIANNKIIIAQGTEYLDSIGFELLILNKNLDSLNHVVFPKLGGYQFFSERSIILYDQYYVISGYSKIDENNWPAQLYWIDTASLEVDTIINSIHGDSTSMVYGDMFVDNEGLLTLFFTQLNGVNRRRGVVKFNEEKEIKWKWLSDAYSIGWGETTLMMSNGFMIYKELASEGLGSWPRNLVCMDGNKNQVWVNHERGSLYGAKYTYSISETSGNDIIGCGRLDWHFKYEGNEQPPPEDLSDNLYTAAYITKIDGDDGETIWDRAIIVYDTFGNISPQFLTDIWELSDGSIIAGGTVNVYDSLGNFLAYDSWVIRLDSNGCFYPGCEFEEVYSSTSGSIQVLPVSELYSIYPNPSSDYLYLRSSQSNKECFYQIYNNQGILVVKSRSFEDVEHIDLSSFSTGTYTILISDVKGRFVESKRFIVIK